MPRSAAILALALIFSFATASAAERPQRRAQPNDRDRRCAAEGEGFVYSKETNTCVRVGGLVGAGGSVGTPTWSAGR